MKFKKTQAPKDFEPKLGVVFVVGHMLMLTSLSKLLFDRSLTEGGDASNWWQSTSDRFFIQCLLNCDGAIDARQWIFLRDTI